jgi:hypothetical protein
MSVPVCATSPLRKGLEMRFEAECRPIAESLKASGRIGTNLATKREPSGD